MAALDSFKVDEAIAPVAPTARAHNRLADLIANMQGEDGIEVTVSEGRILIKRTKVGASAPGSNTGGSGGGSSVPDPLTVAVANVTSSLNLGSGKLVWSTASNKFVYTNGSNQVQINASGLWVYNGTASQLLEMNFGDITHAMSVREIDVCDAGVAKKMLVLGSAPY